MRTCTILGGSKPLRRYPCNVVIALPTGETSMAAPIHHLESSLKHGGSESVSVPFRKQWDLEDDRILIDIETEMALHSHMESKQDKFSQRIPRFLLAGRTLGPLSVLLLLA